MANSYYVLGSSNLTLAGLGLKKTSNVELNTAQISANNDYEEVKKWFQQLWATTARNYTIVEKKEKNYKEYVIEQISQFYKKYTPDELYYKTLFELFKGELPELEAEARFNSQIGHLKDTVLYKTLYPFQQSGVKSLIRKIQKYNGAILADAVGLGKTWQALGVMKFFELSGYKVILLCPKKLEQNWRKYKQGHNSRFEADRLNYVIRYHTDLQDDRLENKDDKYLIKKYFQRNAKVLFVIDESHNLRNDKSSRTSFWSMNCYRKIQTLECCCFPQRLLIIT
ncbi:MAG: DEAD/DEAH box helicase family protein [Saprospiraceae bacterium]|nr:DEAD/DEAH box helicase family protein [Saprospiraceae bacterium]